MKEQTQQRKQTVYFEKNGIFNEAQLSMSEIYSEVHAQAKNKKEYGTSANQLINEMLANLCELAFQKKINLTAPFVITDYGCGRSTASNVLAQVVAQSAEDIDNMLKAGTPYGEIVGKMAPIIADINSKKVEALPQIAAYGHVTVQRFDIGIPEFSKPLQTKADVVFCNDVFEHIPFSDIPAFVADLENAGKYVVASISLRDAVNYNKIAAEILEKKATPVKNVPTSGILLTQDDSGDYIFSLHVTVMPQDKWQELLGEKWNFLPAQDYTACSAVNFVPSPEYKNYKRELISEIGFADFIPFPTKKGSRYEQDPILFHRTASMQVQKHLYKLNALEDYSDSEFSRKERLLSENFLQFVGAVVNKNPKTGLWELAQELPSDWLNKLYALEKESKVSAATDKEVADAAQKIIEDYIKTHK